MKFLFKYTNLRSVKALPMYPRRVEASLGHLVEIQIKLVSHMDYPCQAKKFGL